MSDETIKFGKIRAIFWPVQSFEIKKVLPMALMMFCVLFNYTILRDVKDSLIVTAPGSGAEAIAFLKVWGTLPFAIILMAIYAKLSSVFSKPKLFYTMIMIFVAFFALFGLVLFPLKDSIHMSMSTITQLKEAYPRFQWIIPIIGNWSYALFYIFSELWGTVGLSVLFWQFANDITKISEAKRFYALFGLIGNMGLLFSGELLVQATNMGAHLSDEARWAMSMKWIIGALLIMCGVIIYAYYWMQKNVLTDTRLYDPASSAGSNKKKKMKLSFTEGLKVVFSSQYLGLLAIIVLAYGISINLIEITWKSQLKLQFPQPADYTHFMGRFSQITGFVTIILMIVGANIVRAFGWLTGALLTPLMLLATGGLFFCFILFGSSMSWLTIAMGVTPVLMAVAIGTIQNALTKGTKYALFDPTKEMAYIPLDDELKVKGKAAVDGVGGRLGKSGGAIIQQIMLLSIVGSTQLTIAPYLGGILLIIVLAWTGSVFGLSKLFNSLNKQREEEKQKITLSTSPTTSIA